MLRRAGMGTVVPLMVVALFILSTSVLASNAVVLGSVASSGVLVDGVEVLEGTTLVSPVLVATTSEPATISLGVGGVLRLAENSSALLQAGSNADITVEVRSGEVTTSDRFLGEIRTSSGDDISLVRESRMGSREDLRPGFLARAAGRVAEDLGLKARGRGRSGKPRPSAGETEVSGTGNDDYDSDDSSVQTTRIRRIDY